MCDNAGMSSPSALAYLAGYPPAVIESVRRLLETNRFADVWRRKYPATHPVRTDKALYAYVQEIKNASLRHAGPLGVVVFDNSLRETRQALGLHTRVARVQGGRVKAKREVRISTLFKAAPPEFLRMIVVHELAHFKEGEHNKAFYQLCEFMEPDYHQLEFDVRAYLCYLDASGEMLWR